MSQLEYLVQRGDTTPDGMHWKDLKSGSFRSRHEAHDFATNTGLGTWRVIEQYRTGQAVPIVIEEHHNERPILVVPHIHMGGTAAKDLYDQFDNVLVALRNAQTAMRNAAPNARDYPNGTFERAMQQHADRLDVVVRLKREYDLLLSHAAEAMLT
jgi:hypothetical protein